MAIQVNTSFSGIQVDNAYARIEDFNGYKIMDIQVFYYANHQKAVDGEAFKREQYSFPPDVRDGSPNYHKQGYEFIKTLPQFAGAIDV